MTELADRIATRLIVEKGYAILADRDDYPVLPEESELKARLDQEQDETTARRISTEWVEADRRLLKQQPLIGGALEAFPQLIDKEVYQSDIFVVSRTLRSMTRNCTRVLIKRSVSPVRIALIVEGDVPAELVPASFGASSRDIQRELNYVPDPYEDELLQDDLDYCSPLELEVIVLDNSQRSAKIRQRLHRLADDARKTRAVQVVGLHSIARYGKTWTTSPLKSWRQAWFVRHALRRPASNLDNVIKDASVNHKPWLRSGLVVLLTLVAGLSGRFLLPATDLWVELVRDVLVPGSVISLACWLQRVRVQHFTYVTWAPPLYSVLMFLSIIAVFLANSVTPTIEFTLTLLISTGFNYLLIHLLVTVTTFSLGTDKPLQFHPMQPY